MAETPACREGIDIDTLGRIVTVSPVQSVEIEDKLAVVPDSSLSTFLMPGLVIEGSDKVEIEDKPATGVGHQVTGGVMATGSDKVTFGDSEGS